MKQTFTFILAFITLTGIFAQNSGKGFSYQAVARDPQGDVLTSTNIQLRFSLMPGQMAVTPSWQETQVTTTDAFGTFAVIIGKGIKTAGTAAKFSDVNFASAAYWLKVEILDNSVYKEISYTALGSVPYAEVAGNAQSCPIGMIMPFAGDTSKIPTGWMLCDGRELDRIQFAPLYYVIGTAWGTSNNSLFNIPDLRGLFLRGVDYNAGNDPDKDRRLILKPGGNVNNNVGSFQTISTALPNNLSISLSSYNHSHSYYGTKGGTDCNPSGYVKIGGGNNCGLSSTYAYSINGDTHSHNVTINGGGSETRPRNANVNYIIKY
jgi:microcystin-dependent protein